VRDVKVRRWTNDGIKKDAFY
jgi:hypothetical protein